MPAPAVTMVSGGYQEKINLLIFTILINSLCVLVTSCEKTFIRGRYLLTTNPQTHESNTR